MSFTGENIIRKNKKLKHDNRWLHTLSVPSLFVFIPPYCWFLFFTTQFVQFVFFFGWNLFYFSSSSSSARSLSLLLLYAHQCSIDNELYVNSEYRMNARLFSRWPQRFIGAHSMASCHYTMWLFVIFVFASNNTKSTLTHNDFIQSNGENNDDEKYKSRWNSFSIFNEITIEMPFIIHT